MFTTNQRTSSRKLGFRSSSYVEPTVGGPVAQLKLVAIFTLGIAALVLLGYLAMYI
jgi:hypothetical protein